MLKKIFNIIVLGLLLILLSACQTQAKPTDSNLSEDQPETQEMVTVTINDSTQINYAPIFFAEEEGYFEEYGIQLEFLSFNRVSEAVPLLVSGQLDVYAGSISSGLINIFRQEPRVKAVADRGKMVQDSCTFQAIVVRKDLYDSGTIKEPADLKGMTIAASTSAARGFHLSTYLAQGGLTFDDVNIVDLPSSIYIESLENKTVDLIVLPEIVLTRLLLDGNAVVLYRAEDVI